MAPFVPASSFPSLLAVDPTASTFPQEPNESLLLMLLIDHLTYPPPIFPLVPSMSNSCSPVERLGMKLKADPALNLVKGRGGALLREKMVEVCAKKFIVIVDDSKMVPGLGVTGAMPVEITPFCHEHTQRTILELPGVKGAATGKLRMDGDKPYVTDNDNYIVDLYYTDPIADVKAVARALEGVVGVVEHGFFLDMTTAVIVAGKEGIEVINKK
ncbi:ribose-5-phosphate isomerase [Nannochloropsis gaditana]|uniref:ribose-5-phosphate isomerase n=1 Tax=Nannochloropsis gaditana TaxID=72520 RepID=W7TTC1_9STRA|nr:ribose-5-phosphate isomerase [Nannochloropsis gaditana]